MTMKIPNWNKLVETIGVEGIMQMVRNGYFEASVTEHGRASYTRTLRVNIELDEVFSETNIEHMIAGDWDESSILDWFYDNANIIDEGISYGEETHFETDDYDAEDYDWEVSDGSRLNDLVEAIINEQ
jgi:hypothetical protein